MGHGGGGCPRNATVRPQGGPLAGVRASGGVQQRPRALIALCGRLSGRRRGSGAAGRLDACCRSAARPEGQVFPCGDRSAGRQRPRECRPQPSAKRGRGHHPSPPQTPDLCTPGPPTRSGRPGKESITRWKANSGEGRGAGRCRRRNRAGLRRGQDSGSGRPGVPLPLSLGESRGRARVEREGKDAVHH